jgi:hypothetical protein
MKTKAERWEELRKRGVYRIPLDKEITIEHFQSEEVYLKLKYNRWHAKYFSMTRSLAEQPKHVYELRSTNFQFAVEVKLDGLPHLIEEGDGFVADPEFKLGSKDRKQHRFRVLSATPERVILKYLGITKPKEESVQPTQ